MDYDTARRLVEVTRSAVMDGDTCITPETITEYTRDAMGRILTTREHIGPMLTEHSTVYDEAGRLTRLTTFRARSETISTDPTERTDGDSTHWSYDPASGLELSKTYADGSCITKTYDNYGRLATETNARGVVKTYSYHSTRGDYFVSR